jgi:hypothetical protein
VTKALLFLLLLGLAGPACARERTPAVAFHHYHVRVTLGGEVLVDRDMDRTTAWLGEIYRRTWTAFLRDPCAGADGGLSIVRTVSVRLGNAPAPVRDRPYPPHAFLLTVEASLPPTLRGRDGACAANPAANRLSLSQFVILRPGKALRIARDHGLIIEISRL